MFMTAELGVNDSDNTWMVENKLNNDETEAVLICSSSKSFQSLNPPQSLSVPVKPCFLFLPEILGFTPVA